MPFPATAAGASVPVRALISDTVWTPGRDYGRGPAVSVLMPTFRRAADGLLERAIRSVLDQAMDDLELIVVDDASTDGSADVLRRLMEEDGRISVLTHPRNIGLPAVSEFEAYRRARGERIGFGFDDFVFRPGAYETLLAEAETHPEAAIHGGVSWHNSLDDEYELGREVASYDRLHLTNFIGNGSVLLPRHIVEDVGLYDPHVSLARICDWDLWRRVHAKHPWRSTGVVAGHEHGAARKDSVGNTYPMYFEATQEIMAEPRDALLRPDVFASRDVWSSAPGLSVLGERHVDACRRFFSVKAWAPPADAQPARGEPRAVVGLFGLRSISTAMLVEGLPDAVKTSLNFIECAQHSDYTALSLARCDVVLFTDTLDRDRGKDAAALCRLLGTPHYALLDAVLGSSVSRSDGAPATTANDLQEDADVWDGLAGVLAGRSAPPLVFDAGMRRKLDRLPRPRRDDGELRVGYLGGSDRTTDLLISVLPALARQKLSPVLYARGEGLEPHGAAVGVEVRPGNRSDYLWDLLAHCKQSGLDVLVQPRSGAEDRIAPPAAVLLADYLGIPLIAADEPALAAFGEAEGVLKGDGQEAWAAALARVADRETSRDLVLRLREATPRLLPAAKGAAVFRRLLKRVRAADDRALEARHRLALFDGFGRFSAAKQLGYGLEASLRTARAELAALHAEAEAARRQAAEMLDAAGREQARFLRAQAQFDADGQAARGRVAELEDRLRAGREALERLLAVMGEVERSRSWRVTAPLRTLRSGGAAGALPVAAATEELARIDDALSSS